MGFGEEYWVRFAAWWGGQSPEVRKRVRERYPEPEGWARFWDMADRWVTQAEAGEPPVA